MPGMPGACGKVILLGEHAVVYGVPAIAVGIDRGATAKVSWLKWGPSILSVPAWAVEVREDEDHDLARALAAVVKASGVTRPARVEGHADLPPGGGLGCSAALGVAVARALDPSASNELIAQRVMSWERVFHGNPSGIDGAVSAFGGCLLFEKGKSLEAVHVPVALRLCVGSTGRASSTKSMVESVAKLRTRRPEVVQKAFEGIASLVRNARLAIEAGDTTGLGKLMDLNQMLLSGLFVSTQEIERLCDLARSAGALGAKLTGAGGGGCVVAIVPSQDVSDRVLGAWKTEGFDGFSAGVARDAGGGDVAREAGP